LYQHLRLAIEALQWVYQSKQRLSGLLSQLHRYRRQCLAAQHEAKQAQQTIQEYWRRLSQQQQVQGLESQALHN